MSQTDQEFVAWLAGLKVGDEVIYRGRWENHLARVQHVTPKQVIVENVRFWRKNGREVGCGWSSRDILRPTPEEVREIEDTVNRRTAISAIRAITSGGTDTSKIPLANLKAALAALTAKAEAERNER